MRLRIFALLLFGVLSYGAFAQNEIKSPSHEVFIFLHESCKISQFYMPLLDSLSLVYGREVRFVGVFPNESSTEKGVDSFRSQFNIQFELLQDYKQHLTKKYSATVTPELVVVDLRSAAIVYQGRIDDSYFRVGKRKTVKQTQELVDVLQAIAEGREVDVISQPAIGCFIQQ